MSRLPYLLTFIRVYKLHPYNPAKNQKPLLITRKTINLLWFD